MHVLWHVVGENGQLTTVARVLLSSATNQAADRGGGGGAALPCHTFTHNPKIGAVWFVAKRATLCLRLVVRI
jgi:hypothetical protein